MYKIYAKLLLVMRLTTVLLIATLMQVSAAGLAQRITLNARQLPLEQALKEIRKQSGYDFLFDRKLINRKRNVDLALKDATLSQAMESLLSGLPLSYTISGKIVAIKPKESSFVQKMISRFAEIDIKGVVTNEGKPVAGASISVKGTSRVVNTNEKGEFFIENVDEDAIILISYVGFESRELRASQISSMGAIILMTQTSELDDVQVIAYGTTTKRLSPGAQSTVDAKTIERQPVPNPLAALIGRVPGLDIVQESGLSGGGFTVRIRGQNSLLNSNEPLFLIDGVPFATNAMTVGNKRNQPTVTGQQAGGASPFNVLNPADIESISVLKDADATAIYGSRGANGVVLITTKRGKAGETQVNVSASAGITEVARFQEMMDRRQYLDMRYEALRNDGIDWKSPSYTQAADLKVLDTNVNNDIQQQLLGGTGKMNNINASVSGGNANLRFLMGAGYFKESSFLPGDQYNEKVSGKFSIDHNAINNKFTAQLNGNYAQDFNNTVSTDLQQRAMSVTPIQNLRTPEGKLNWETGQNPLASLYQPYSGKTRNMQVNSVLGYKILPNLQVKLAADYSLFQFNSVRQTPETSLWPLLFNASQRSAEFGKRNSNTVNIEPQLTYNVAIGPGKLDVLAGGTYQQTNQEGTVLYASGFLDDVLMYDVQSAPTVSTSSGDSEYKYNAVFGRIGYNIANKYILSLNGRRDGSSRFGPANRFENFGSVGAAWIFSEEQLIKNNLGFLSFGKIRLSHGTTGSDRIDDYRYLALYRAMRTAEYNGPGSALIPENLANPDYQWETNRKTDVALTLGFLKDRILLEGNYFSNRSSNQLVGLPLPTITGFSSVVANLPATVQNTGIELELSTTNIQSNAFRWNTSFNMTLPKNKLIAYPNLESSPYANNYVVGQPITLVKVYPYGGIDPQTGLRVYKNRLGESTSDKRTLRQEDRTVFLDMGPKYYGGFMNNFNYKGFDLEVFFSFSQRNGVTRLSEAVAGRSLQNQPLYIFERRWQKPGDVTDIPKFTSLTDALTNANAIGRDDEQAYRKINYARLKNLSLYYTIPSRLVQGISMKNVRVYMQAQNLLTITNYEGMDPENASSGTGPLRVITGGLQINL
jgi:TonB-linked SusC/RagA family outer membrane protein